MSPASTPWFRRWGPWLLVLAVAAASGWRASHSGNVGGDFLRCHRAGRLVATGRAEEIYRTELLRAQSVYAEERAADRTARGEEADPLPEQEFEYLPATAVLLAPLGAMHPRDAWIVWSGWNGLMIGLTFLAAWRVASQVTPARWFLVVALALLHAANENLQLGQLDPTAIAAATLSIQAFSRGRDAAAGLLAGFGGAVKFYPWALALWFLWKRSFFACAMVVIGMGVFAWGVPAAVLGPARATALTQEYLDVRAHRYTGAAPADVPGASMKALVYRTLGGVPYQAGPDEDRVVREICLARVPSEVLKWLVVGLAGVLLWVVLMPAWGPLRAGLDPRGPPEAGLFVCWILLASPEARGPHFLYLVLPVSALVAGLVHAWRDRLPGCRVALVLGAVGVALLQTDSARIVGEELKHELAAWCSLGFGTAAILAALLVVHRPAR